MQEWRKDDELKARLSNQKRFVIWPADDSGKKQRSSSMAVKLNKCLLLPLVGRAELEPKLISVDVLELLLMDLREDWEVSG